MTTSQQSVKVYWSLICTMMEVGNQQKTVLRHVAIGVKYGKVAYLFISVSNNE